VRSRLLRRLARWLPTVALAVFFLAPSSAQAQVNVTPNFSITPSSATTKWIIWMALGALILAVVVLIGVAVSYLRFAPKFFGREEAPKRLPPGARPPLMARTGPAQPVGATRPAVALSSSARTATAVAERPPPAARPEPATPLPAAVPAAETAPAEAPALAVAPEATPAAAPEAAPAPATAPEAAPAQATAPEATPAAAPEAAPAPAKAPAEAQPAAHGSASALDQETFDRVLEEQLGKGVDRRVAEGRARAAAVVAARKKAQG
jgi:hypothetical protein